MTKFLIDTNSLIEAKDFFYAFDICPGFWRAISRHHEIGELFSIDRVRDELMEGNDPLVDWARDMPNSFFMTSATPAAVFQYSQIIQWVQSSFTRQAAVDSFAAKADGWLIAAAKVHGCTIVCEEKYDPTVQRRVPNPNVCRQFGVPYCNVFDVLRELKVRFGLKKLS